MASARKPSPRTEVRNARNRLVRAIENYATAFGEAQRTNGYRMSKPNDDALYQRKRVKWSNVGIYREILNSSLAGYTRAVRKAGR